MSLGKWRTFNLHKDVDWITSPWNPSHIGGPTLLWLCLETRSTRVKVKLGHKRWNPNPGGLQSHGQGARPLRKPPLPNFDLGLSVPKLWGHGFLGWGSQSLIFGDGGPSQVNSRESDRFEGLQRTRQVSFSHSFMTHYSVCMRTCVCACVYVWVCETQGALRFNEGKSYLSFHEFIDLLHISRSRKRKARVLY